MSDAQPPPPFPPPPSYPPAPPPPHQVPSSQRFPTWKQALVMLFGGIALAVSACFGCAFTVDLARGSSSRFDGLATLLGIVAFGGLCASLVGVVLVLMRILRALFAKKDQASS
jgi:hypothetical protein